jgi:hypothetical protein
MIRAGDNPHRRRPAVSTPFCAALPDIRGVAGPMPRGSPARTRPQA